MGQLAMTYKNNGDIAHILMHQQAGCMSEAHAWIIDSPSSGKCAIVCTADLGGCYVEGQPGS